MKKTNKQTKIKPPQAEVEWEVEGVTFVYLLPEPQGLAHLCLRAFRAQQRILGPHLTLKRSPACGGGVGDEFFFYTFRLEDPTAVRGKERQVCLSSERGYEAALCWVYAHIPTLFPTVSSCGHRGPISDKTDLSLSSQFL